MPRTALAVLSLVASIAGTLIEQPAPLTGGRARSVETSLATVPEPAGERDSRRQLLRGTLSVENAGGVDLVLLGGMYLVLGFDTSLPSSVGATTLPRRFWEEQAQDGRAHLMTQGFLLDPYGGLDDLGGPVIVADTKRQLGLVTYVPQGQFERYVTTVVVVLARADMTRAPGPPKLGAVRSGRVTTDVGRRGLGENSPREGTTRISEIGRLETSWVDGLVRGDGSIYVIYSPRWLDPQGNKAPGRPSRVLSPWPVVAPCVSKASDDRCARLADAVSRNEDVAKELRKVVPWNDDYGINLSPAWTVS